MSLKRDCGIAFWRGAAIGASATNLRRETESRRRRELTSQQRPTSARWSALQSQLSPRCCPCACTGARSAYRTTQALRDWIRVFVVATVAPSGAEADLHQSSVACGFSWSMCLSDSALGRMPSSIRLFYDVFSFSSAGDVVQCMAGRILGRSHAFFFLHQVLYLADHRAGASVWRTSALSSRTCTFMQGLQFS